LWFAEKTEGQSYDNPFHPPPTPGVKRRAARTLFSALLPLMLAGAALADPAVIPTAPTIFKPLVGNIPPAVRGAMALGTRLDSQTKMDIILSLPFRDKAGLDDLDIRLSTAGDPLYGKNPTSQEMIDRFCPTQADYDAVISFAKSKGLTVTQTYSNRLLVDVSGSASAIENAFKVHLMQFQDKDGRTFHAPDQEPSVPAALAPHLLGVLGLDDNAVVIPQAVRGKTPAFKGIPVKQMAPDLRQPVGPGDPGGGGGGSTPALIIANTALAGTRAVSSAHFTGPYGGISPNDIKTAYNLNSIPSTGQGQIIDFVELNGFNPNDITVYENTFGLPHVPIQIFSVDGVSNTINNNSTPVEATLDIELAVAVAPGTSLIRVYEGPTTFQGYLDVLTNITSLRAYQTSCSWAFSENALSNSQKQTEGNLLQYLISVSNTFFTSSGDWGPYDSSRSNVTALDPASQGWACAVGGTTLSTNADGSYASETTWNEPATSYNKYQATGGGISDYWLNRVQKPVITSASGGSTAMRDVPDVSLNAYPDYEIYFAGSWQQWGGTSASTPIWAGFLALVNGRLNGTSFQQVAPLSDFAHTLYTIAQGPRYNADFYDIADGSNNKQFSNGPGNQVVPGYDLVTGLGSFNGANLFADLVAAAGGR